MTVAQQPGGVVLGIDIGTTYSKGVACRGDGTIVARGQRRHEVERPAAGWVEHDAEAVWWGDTVALCRELAEAVGAEPIGALAITTCGPCLVPVDAAGRPLRPGILYGVDTRATEEIAWLEARIGRAAIQRRSGMPLTSQSVGPKLAWVVRHEPAVAERTAVWHTATSFIVARLTGVAVIDHHQAAYFGPFIDRRRRAWDLRDGADLGLEGRLPALRWPGEIAAGLTEDAARATGLPAGIPVLVGTSDGPTEALAAGAMTPGIVAITHGSTTTLTAFARPARRATGLWQTEGWAPDRPCVGAGLSATGALLGWAAGLLAPDIPTDQGVEVLLDEAATSPPGANGVLVVPSFAGERAPVDDPAARGVIAGLALDHTRADVARAILEGIAFGIRGLLESFEAAGIPTDRLRATGGGSRHALAMRIVADVTGRPQEVGGADAGAALGAARLAAEAIGAVTGDDWFRPDHIVAPDTATRDGYDERYRSFRRLVRATRPVVHALVDEAAR